MASTQRPPPADAAPLMLGNEVSGRQAWRRGDIGPGDWLVTLPGPCLEELESAVRAFRQDPLPLLLVAPAPEAFPVCAELMGRVRDRLLSGVGLVVLDRVPVERYGLQDNQVMCWLLGQLLGRPVAQKWDGTMLYDVRDTGRTLEYGVRRSVTNLDLTFHTDGPWLRWPPELVGLYCINPARAGGVSRVVSLGAVHNEISRRRPGVLPRLYRRFPWDRQAEHAPDDGKVGEQPIFQYDGRALIGRFNERLIEAGAALGGVTLDAEGQEALDVMRDTVDAPDLCVEFTIERGQVQYLDNRRVVHSRTDFEDASEPHLKRHLIRLWTREEGRRTFHG